MRQTILLAVDDRAEHLFIIEELMAQHLPDCQVITAQSPEEGLAIAAEREVDVAIIDMQLPNMDGIEMVKHMKANTASAHVPVVLVTAHDSQPELRVRGLEAGADDFISKPIATAEMVAKIKVMLRIKRAEDERARLLTVIEQTADAIVVLDLERVIQYVNPAFERMSGYPRDEIVGQTSAILRAESDDESVHRNLWSSVEQGNVWRGRLRRRRKDGTEYKVEATISPVRDPAGRIAHIVSSSKDISREVDLEERLGQAEKMEAMGTLASGIAHDFNNILYAILGFNELALTQLPNESELRPLLEEVDVAARRGADLVGRILTIGSRRGHEHKPIQLQPSIDEAMNLLRGSLPSTVEIQTSISPECGPVVADPTEIHQIVMNLCTNAYHAMGGRGGLIEVRLEEVSIEEDDPVGVGLAPGKFARLSVTDSGQGMDEETLGRIFEPYFTTKEQGQGTGLGLATVHGIVESCGGRITARSELGNGAVFRIFLPICIAETVPHEAKMGKTVELQGHESVLIVDNEKSVLNIQEMMLERLGYRVTAFDSGMDALQAFRESPKDFDIILTDLIMPKLSGFELAKAVLGIRPDLPVIICTGQGDMLREGEVKAAGVRGFLRKPFDLQILASAVRNALTASTQEAKMEDRSEAGHGADAARRLPVTEFGASAGASDHNQGQGSFLRSVSVFGAAGVLLVALFGLLGYVPGHGRLLWRAGRTVGKMTYRVLGR